MWIIGVLCILASCKKNDQLSPVIGFDTFKILAQNNEGLTTDINGIINGDNITIKIPAAADITKLKPTFQLSNPQTIVYVNRKPQENGVDSIDFSQPVTYDLKTRNNVRSFTVTAVKTAAFTKFSLLASDNPGVLFKDYTATIKGLNVTVKVPVGTDISSLKASFETTAGATVKVNGALQQSGTNANDFTNPLVYEVSDAETPVPAGFTVTVGFLTAPVWQMIADQNTLSENIAVSTLRLAVHPVTNQPYVTYQISSSKKIGVSAYNGTTWESIDGGGISEGEGREPMIAFDANGTLYVGYKDYADVSANQQKLTVRKYDNGQWSTLGSPRFTPTKSDYQSMNVDAEGKVWVSLAKQDAAADATGFERRQLYTMKFENNAWTRIDLPSKVLTSGSKLTVAGEKFYMGIMDRTTGSQRLSAFEWQNNQWTAIGPTSFSADGKVGSTQMTMAVAPDGTKYMAYLNNGGSNAKTIYVLKFNGSSWEIFATPINVVNASEVFALTVHPNGTVLFAYMMPDGLYVRSFNKQTNNWDAPNKLVNGSVGAVDLMVSKDGIPFLSAGLSNRMEVWKLDIPK